MLPVLLRYDVPRCELLSRWCCCVLFIILPFFTFFFFSDLLFTFFFPSCCALHSPLLLLLSFFLLINADDIYCHPPKKSKPFFTHLLSLFEPLPNIVFLFKFPHRSCCVAVFVLHVSVAVFLLFTCFLLSFFFFLGFGYRSAGLTLCAIASLLFFFSPFSSLTRLTARKSRVRGIFVKQPSTEAVFFFFYAFTDIQTRSTV